MALENNHRLLLRAELEEALDQENQQVLLSPEGLSSLKEWLQRGQRLACDLLLCRMKELCQRYCQEPWLEGFEYALWRSIQEGPEVMDEAEVAEVDGLADDAGGWWTWPLGAEAPHFIRYDEWQKLYEHRTLHEKLPNRDLESQNQALKKHIQDLEALLQKT